LIRKRRGPFGTGKIDEIDAASPRGCIFAGRIPQEVQAKQSESRQNAQRRIPTLYVPLRIFGCLEAVFGEANVAV
jgi:hypothetical protein